MNARNQIYQLLEEYNDPYWETSETGWNYKVTTGEKVFNDIQQFYTPRCYNKQGEYIETDNLQDFICYNSPYYLIDAIEFFAKHNQHTDFEGQINAILKSNGIALRLDNGRVESIFNSQIKKSILA